MLGFIFTLYLGGVLANYSELRSYETGDKRSEDLFFALGWPMYIWSWLKPTKGPGQ